MSAIRIAAVLLLLAPLAGCGKKVSWNLSVEDKDAARASGALGATEAAPPGDASLPAGSSASGPPAQTEAIAAFREWAIRDLRVPPEGVQVVWAGADDRSRALLKFQLGADPISEGTARISSDRGRAAVESLFDPDTKIWTDPDAFRFEWHSRCARKTMQTIRTLGTAVESYAVDNNFYPQVPAAQALAGFLEPTYIRKAPVTDGWGRPVQYWTSPPGSYCILSTGGDGVPDRPIEEYKRSEALHVDAPFGRTEAETADVLFCTGSFLRYYGAR